jgi:hypothetical protein
MNCKYEQAGKTTTHNDVGKESHFNTKYLKVRLGKVTSLYMPRRASWRKFGKSLKLHMAKQKKQKLEETRTDVCRREKCIEKKNVCFEEAQRESIKEDKKKAVDTS